MKVLVTDGDQRPALAVARSLGRRGITVLVGGEKSSNLASSSKYCGGQVSYPSPYFHPKRFYHYLLKFLRENSVDVLVPITDVTTYLTSMHKEEIEQYTRLPIPAFKSFDFVSNKWKLLRCARRMGIPVPRTYFIEKPENVRESIAHLTYPVVVKPFRSRILTDSGWLLTKVHYANSETEILKLYREKYYLRFPSMIQEYITGPGLGFFVLYNKGRLVTTFSHKRLREKPPSGGVSVFRDSIPIDSNLREYTNRLFKPFRWHGVAMVEYKIDEETNQPFLMEVNGRFWGSLQLAIDSGVDFPDLLCRLATDGDVEGPSAYLLGVKSRWLLGDLDHLALRIFKKQPNIYLPQSFPSKARTLIEFLKFYEPGLHYEVLSLSDPRPFLHELFLYCEDLFRGKGALQE